MNKKIPEESEKETVEKLRAENRKLLKLNKILRREIEELKDLKPGQITRSKQRELDKLSKLCHNCSDGEIIIQYLPFGELTLCSKCNYKKLIRKEDK